MKWGVRRYQSYDTVPRGSGKGGKEIGEAKKEKKAATKEKAASYRNMSQNRRNLSDSDLRKQIDRLTNEKKLRELPDEEVSPGKKFVKDVLTSSMKAVAITALAGAAKYAIIITKSPAQGGASVERGRR